MRLGLSPFLMAFATAQAVEIIPPSPYMSSPPPVQADTSVIDPGRKPSILTVEPGIQEQWYADWNLVTDRSSSAPLEITAPRSGRGTFRVAFNDHGWPTEVSYFDSKANPRWTKLFRYPTKLPPGSGDVSFASTWISANGAAISMTKISDTYKSTTWKVGQRKYKVSDQLGEPLIVETGYGVGKGVAEAWRYLVDGKEIIFSFDKDNLLMSVPGAPEATVEAPKLVAPVVAPAPVDSVKPSKKKKAKK